MKRTWPAELNRSTPNGREVPAHCKAYPAPLHSRFPSFRANSATWWATPSSCAASRTLSRPPPSVSIALLDGQPEWYIVLVTFTIEIEREDDGRWLAEVPALPGVLAYGQDPDESVARVQALALRVIAERLEHRETPAEFLNVSFQAA